MRFIGYGVCLMMLTAAASPAATLSASEPTHLPPPVPAWMQEAMSSGVFQKGHPDVRGQQKGLRFYQQGRFATARQAFETGARFGDKASQAMIAQMYWRGEGVDTNRVRGYVWMDLAAERGYPVFLIEREKMWRQLSEAERTLAAAIGPGIHAEFGDEAAKPRLAREMRLGRFRTLTGSRAGYDAGVRVAQQRADGSYDFRGTSTGGNIGSSSVATYHKPDYWNERRYWQIQDRMWHAIPTGEVVVHPVEQAAESPR